MVTRPARAPYQYCNYYYLNARTGNENPQSITITEDPLTVLRTKTMIPGREALSRVCRGDRGYSAYGAGPSLLFYLEVFFVNSSFKSHDYIP